MTDTTQKTTIADYLRCSFPCLAVETYEESRLTDTIVDLTKTKGFDQYSVYTISATKNLVAVIDAKIKEAPEDDRDPYVVEKGVDFGKAFGMVAAKQDSVLIVFDFHHIIANGGAYRSLKDQFNILKANGSCVIMVAPTWTLPAELTHDVVVLEFSLPTREELGVALDVVVESARHKAPEAAVRTQLLDAACGLTVQEAENAFSLSVSKTKTLSPALVSGEKMKLIRSSGLLTIEPPPAVEPGGLGEAKRYILEEVIPVKDDPQLRVKGILSVGVPGTGKTLLGRAIGAMLGWPVLGCDIGSLKGGVQGQSESNIRRMTQMVEAVAPCVLLLDEIEKGVGGHESSSKTDGGVTLGMVGHLLKWMEDQKGVLVVMTCNEFKLLPAPLTRPGRIDALFFVDLPNYGEREEIALNQLKRYVDDPDGHVKTIAELADGWTGAEIEQLVKSAARRTQRNITRESLVTAAKGIRPISKTRANEIAAMRAEAKDVFQFANTIEDTSGMTKRKMR